MRKSFFNFKIFALKIYLCESIHLALQVVTERQNYKVCKTPARLEKVFLFLFRLSRLTIISDIIYVTVDVHFNEVRRPFSWFYCSDLHWWLVWLWSPQVRQWYRSPTERTHPPATVPLQPRAGGLPSACSVNTETKSTINYTCIYWMIMNRWIDKMTDRWTNRQGDF